jgi:Na+/melibiose symporter-like transporter
MMLAVVHFPQTSHLQQGTSVDPSIVRNLALLYLPTVVLLYLVSAVWLTGYRITRETHEANLRSLADRKSEDASTP